MVFEDKTYITNTAGIIDIFYILLVISTFLCSLVAGFLFAFAVVVMTGIHKLADKSFLQAFKEMDGIIQNNQPLFMLVWVGSVFALQATVIFGLLQDSDWFNYYLIPAALLYLFGVQLPTIRINIPLNNRVQSLDINSLDDEAAKAERENFEARWNHSNILRTIMACVTSLLLISVITIL